MGEGLQRGRRGRCRGPLHAGRQTHGSGGRTGSGAKAIEKLIAGDIAQGGKLTLKTGDVVGFGDYALETGSWVANSPGGKHMDHGPYLTLFKKSGSGWKISRDIWNSSMTSK